MVVDTLENLEKYASLNPLFAQAMYGTQFHPEKSGDTGLRILKAFSEL